MVPDEGFTMTVINLSYHLQGIVFKTIKIYITMSKLSKEKKLIFEDYVIPIVKPKGFIGAIDEDFIEEYLEEEANNVNKDEEE